MVLLKAQEEIISLVSKSLSIPIQFLGIKMLAGTIIKIHIQGYIYISNRIKNHKDIVFLKMVRKQRFYIYR